MTTKRSTTLQTLLHRIEQIAAMDPTTATALPPETYTSSELLARERERIFSREWICVGREDEVPAAGDYFATEVNKVPLIIVRQKDNSILCLVNVCRHRMSVIANGEGNTKSFVCPYHGWTYELDGQLRGAARMRDSKNFKREDCHLPGVQVEVWLGFLFVNLDAKAPPLAPRLGNITELLSNYHPEQMRTVLKSTEYWQTNWKVLVENFLEFYHIGAVHSDTLYPYGTYEKVELLAEADGFSFYNQGQVKSDEFDEIISPDLLIENPDLGEFEFNTTPVGGVFPSHLMSVSWFGILWLGLQPVEPGVVRLTWGVAGPVKGLSVNAESYDGYAFPDLMRQINNEDKPRVEGVQQGAESGRAVSGPLQCRGEEMILHLTRYLARQLSES